MHEPDLAQLVGDPMTEVDLSDVLPCRYCGAGVDEDCVTRTTGQPTKTHACRIVVLETESAAG